mmetsp:Transcript_15175/g.49377  ORF Transcript_15175/g.49377 Transcript_15175/m.49377 type:complete len:214 (+) Transcript_15175:852-1493(+)
MSPSPEATTSATTAARAWSSSLSTVSLCRRRVRAPALVSAKSTSKDDTCPSRRSRRSWKRKSFETVAARNRSFALEVSYAPARAPFSASRKNIPSFRRLVSAPVSPSAVPSVDPFGGLALRRRPTSGDDAGLSFFCCCSVFFDFALSSSCFLGGAFRFVVGLDSSPSSFFFGVLVFFAATARRSARFVSTSEITASSSRAFGGKPPLRLTAST